MTTYVNIEHNLSFIERRESSAIRQALQAVTALHDALALKREIRLPVLAETRDAILELESEILAHQTESAALTPSRPAWAGRHGRCWLALDCRTPHAESNGDRTSLSNTASV